MRAADFPPIPAERARRWMESIDGEAVVRLLGFSFEEIRLDYARLRLRWRDELVQGGGVLHGGIIASVIDTVVVGALLSPMDQRPKRLATIDMHVQFLDAVVGEDVIAEARVRRRGKSIAFLEVDVRTAGGREVAHGELSYRIIL